MPPMNPERSLAQGHRDSVRYGAGKEGDAGCRDVMMNSRDALGDVRPPMMHSHRPGGAWKGHVAMDLNEGWKTNMTWGALEQQRITMRSLLGRFCRSWGKELYLFIALSLRLLSTYFGSLFAEVATQHVARSCASTDLCCWNLRVRDCTCCI